MTNRNFADDAGESLARLVAALDDVGAVTQANLARTVAKELAPFSFFFRRPPRAVPEKMLLCLQRLVTVLDEVGRFVLEMGLESEIDIVVDVQFQLRQAYERMSQPTAPSLVG